MASETFGIDVEIKTEKTEAGLKKVDKALEHTEATARKAGDAASKALAEGMERASRAVDDFEKDALAAFGAVEKSIQRAAKEEKEWEAAIKKSKDALAEATDKGIKAYDDALKASNVTMEKSTSVAKQLVGGWKEIVRGIGDVGNAINAVKQGVELVKSAFETSEKAARAAIAAWHSMDNSGPSAYVGGSTRSGLRLAKINEKLSAIGESYSADNLDIIPEDIRKFITNPALDEGDLDAAIKKRIGTIAKARADIDKAATNFSAAYNADQARREQESRPERLASFEKEDAEITRLMERQIAARERIVRRGGEITQKMLDDEAALDRRAAAFNERLGADPYYRSNRDLAVDSRDEIAGRYDRRAARAAASRDVREKANHGVLDLARDAVAALAVAAAESRAARGRDLDADVARLLREYRDDSSDPFAAAELASGQRRTFSGKGLGFAEKLASGQGLKQQTEDAIKFAEALQGPVGGAIDGLIDGLVKWDMSWKEWGQSALAEIEKVLAKLALLQLVQWGFGQYGGGSTVGQFLWGALGGGPKPGDSSARMAPGDPFGGAGGGTSGAVWREPVQRQAPQGGGGPATPVVNVKVVTVADMRAAALELLSSAEGERAVLNHVQTNSGKLTAGGRR